MNKARKPSSEELAQRVDELESLVAEGLRREESLRESAEVQRGILSATVDGFWLVDRQGRLLEVNDSYSRLSGYSRAELLCLHIADLEAQEDEAAIAGHIRRIHEKGHDTFETIHRRKDGSTWHVEVSASFKEARDGQFVVFVRDITERKEAAEKVKGMMDELELLVEERTNELQRKNIALSEVLGQIDIERHYLEKKVNANIQTLLLPVIEKLIEKSSTIDGRYLKMLKQNLSELTSSQGANLSSPAYNLTPKEMELCGLIKGGFTVKEMAIMQRLSERTIESHRYNIRKKLGISSKSNLVSFLSSL